MLGFLSWNFTREEQSCCYEECLCLNGKTLTKICKVIVFSLQSGDSSSAITLCTKNFGDDQLALAICWLLEGYGCSLEQQFI